MTNLAAEPAPARAALLTERQLDALRLTANGHTARTAARILGQSPMAVTDRLYRAYRNLGVGDRAQAVAVALVLGLIRPEEITLPKSLTAHTTAGQTALDLDTT